MPIPLSKQELTTALNNEFQKLIAEINTVPPSLAREKTLEGNISVCDIIAYQVGWGGLLISWYKSGKEGVQPVLPKEGFKWNRLSDLANHFYLQHEKDSLLMLVTRFREIVNDIQAIIAENSDEQLYTHNVYNWTGIWPLGRWINVNTSSP